MKNIAFLSFFLVSQALATPPIEGGKVATSKERTEFEDVVELAFEFSGECSGTRVKENLILTAAHCVLERKEKEFIYKVNTGDSIKGLGKVTNISIHPLYREAVLDFFYKIQVDREVAEEKRALYDIAFIETNNKKKRKKPFPQIISSATKFKERNKVELAGYGAKNLFWDDGGWNFDFDENTKLRTAQNEWIKCPVDFLSSDLTKIKNLAKGVFESLKIQSVSTHVIFEGEEAIKLSDKGMIMSGDSGSPAMERDINGNIIITGVASTIRPIEPDMAIPAFEIRSEKDELIFLEELKSLPKDWGDKKKSALGFKEIENVLKEKNLLESDGKLKKGIQIYRSYTRVATGNFSDLSHPHNQDFIKGVFSKTP